VSDDAKYQPFPAIEHRNRKQQNAEVMPEKCKETATAKTRRTKRGKSAMAFRAKHRRNTSHKGFKRPLCGT